MYTYIFKGVGFTIKTPGCTDCSQIKREVVQSADKVVNRSTYPNGLVLEVEQKATQTVVYSNRQLIQNSDGSYTAPES